LVPCCVLAVTMPSTNLNEPLIICRCVRLLFLSRLQAFPPPYSGQHATVFRSDRTDVGSGYNPRHRNGCKRVSLTFRHPFWLKGIDRRFAAGQYELITNEEPIEELRFPIYRRVATLIFLPADAGQASSIKMVDVDTADFAAAHERDQRASPPRSPPSGNLKPFEQS
jgi:hypothetical protein